MSVEVKVLVPSKIMEITQQKQYTATNCRAIIDVVTITNTSSSNAVFSLNLIPKDSTADSSNLFVKNRSIAPNESYRCPEIVGHNLEDGGSISTIAGTASALIMRISGREIT